MLDSINLVSYDIKYTLKSHCWRKNVIILSICVQLCYGRHNVSTRDLSILLHGIISLPDAMSYDNWLHWYMYKLFHIL